MTRTKSKATTTREIGTRYPSAAMPAAGTRIARISWVAKAVDAMASVANTRRARRLGRRCCSNSRDASGRPSNSRLSTLNVTSPPCREWSVSFPRRRRDCALSWLSARAQGSPKAWSYPGTVGARPRRRRWRWLVPPLVFALVWAGYSLSGLLDARAEPTLPKRTPAEVADWAASPHPQPRSGFLELNTNLGLGDFSTAGGGGSSGSFGLAAGSNTRPLWEDGGQ